MINLELLLASSPSCRGKDLRGAHGRGWFTRNRLVCVSRCIYHDRQIRSGSSRCTMNISSPRVPNRGCRTTWEEKKRVRASIVEHFDQPSSLETVLVPASWTKGTIQSGTPRCPQQVKTRASPKGRPISKEESTPGGPQPFVCVHDKSQRSFSHIQTALTFLAR